MKVSNKPTAYSKITDIYTLNDVLNYLKSLKTTDDVAVWLDWDENIVNSDTDHILEPQITKRLFQYMLNNRICFSIITGRFWDSVCQDNKRDLVEMKNNVVTTIFPVLKRLGIDVNRYLSDVYLQPHKITDEYGDCIGVMFMGIFFTGSKGATMKHYIRMTGLQKTINIFVDDYEPYLIETTKSMPDIVAFRRHLPSDKSR